MRKLQIIVGLFCLVASIVFGIITYVTVRNIASSGVVPDFGAIIGIGMLISITVLSCLSGIQNILNIKLLSF